MDKDINVAFVILHYIALDVTMKCIASIQGKIKYSNYQIVVVDNGSDNGSGKKLEGLYADDETVSVICNETNLGFSAGNNVGYIYAKKELHAEYIFVVNNDTEIIQEDFIERAIRCHMDTPYYVLGPDIINLEGVHQSPQRDHVITKKEAKRWYRKRYLFSIYLHIHKKWNLPEDFYIYRKYIEHDNKRKDNFMTNVIQENVELQGACFIFSPLYVERNESAFEELTFMYGEEALLLLRCTKNHWKVIYNPELKIRHAEKTVTKRANQNVIDKEIFWSDNHVKAIKTLLKEIDKQGNERCR